jgi:hypothetical protein
VYTARRAPRANSRPDTTLMGTQPTRARGNTRSNRRRAGVDQPPNRHGLRGGHRPDHQRSAPTGETHLPPPQSPASTHLRPSGKESRQATRPNRGFEGGRPLGRHRHWADMGKWAASQTTYDVPAPQRLHSARRYRVAVPRSTHKRPGNLAPHEEQEADAQHPRRA